VVQQAAYVTHKKNTKLMLTLYSLTILPMQCQSQCNAYAPGISAQRSNESFTVLYISKHSVLGSSCNLTPSTTEWLVFDMAHKQHCPVFYHKQL